MSLFKVSRMLGFSFIIREELLLVSSSESVSFALLTFLVDLETLDSGFLVTSFSLEISSKSVSALLDTFSKYSRVFLYLFNSRLYSSKSLFKSSIVLV